MAELKSNMNLTGGYEAMTKVTSETKNITLANIPVRVHSFTTDSGDKFTIFTDGFYIVKNFVGLNGESRMTVGHKAGTFDIVDGAPLVEISYYQPENDLMVSRPYLDSSLQPAQAIAQMKTAWERAERFLGWFEEAKNLVGME